MQQEYNTTVTKLKMLGYRLVLSNDQRSIYGNGVKRWAYSCNAGVWINYTMPSQFTLLEQPNF